MPITQDGMELVYDSGKSVEKGDVVSTHRGSNVTVTGGRAPIHPGSTGSVWVKDERGIEQGYFPSVINARWRTI